MTYKHSPGPWTDQTDNANQWGIYCREGRCVAQAQQVEPLHYDYSQRQRTANARLISKAPAMLDLLLSGLRNLEHADTGLLSPDEVAWQERALYVIGSLEVRS